MSSRGSGRLAMLRVLADGIKKGVLLGFVLGLLPASTAAAPAADSESISASFRRAQLERARGNAQAAERIYARLERYPEAREWLLLVRAEQALDGGDWVSADQRLRRIRPGSPAWEHALELRRRVRLARPREVSVSAALLEDSQPLTATSLAVALSDAVSPALAVKLEHRVDTLAGAEVLQAAGSSVETRLRAGQALLDAELRLRYRLWSDDEGVWTGGVGVVLLPGAPARLRGGWLRTEETGTLSGAAQHIVRDTSFAALSLDRSGFLLEAQAELHWYSDGNAGHAGSIWALAPLIRRSISLHVGWSGSIRDTRESRWDYGSGSYQPYFTPLLAYVHGPLLVVRASAGPFEGSATAAVSLSATDQDPTTFGFYELRRAWTDLYLKGALGLRLPPLLLTATYEHGRQIYYAYHRVQVAVALRF